MEDPKKVDQKILELNKLDKSGGDWVAGEGYVSLMFTEGDLRAKKNIAMNPHKGYAVKLFVNTLNGEIKLFPAILFEKDA